MVHYAKPRAHMLDMAKELFDKVLAGNIVSEPSHVFSLTEAGQAHRLLESRKSTGAIVLMP
jgi:NADPH2:quinone reductase